MVKLGFERAKAIVKELIEKGITVILFGEPGVGKTSLVEEIGKELGYTVHYFNLNYISRTDLVLLTVKEGGRADYTLPESIKEIISNPKTILFFDEFNTAQPELQSILLEITLKKKLFGHDILSKIVLAGNDSFNDLATDTITPLKTRTFKIKLVLELHEFINYIQKKYGHVMNERAMLYLAFLESSKELFINNTEDLNPRVHEFIIASLINFPDIEEEVLISGFSNEHLANKFIAYKKELYDIAKKSLNELIKDFDKFNISQKMFIISKLLESQDENKIIEAVKILLEKKEEEYGVMLFKKYISTIDKSKRVAVADKLLKKLPKIRKVLKELDKLFRD